MTALNRGYNEKLIQGMKSVLDKDQKKLYYGERNFATLEVFVADWDELNFDNFVEYGESIIGKGYSIEEKLGPWTNTERVVHLDERQDLQNHSPDGFEVGYSGSGPTQLALAIMADYTDSDELAEILYKAFRDACVSHLETPFLIWGAGIDSYLQQEMVQLRRPHQHDLFEYLNASVSFHRGEIDK